MRLRLGRINYLNCLPVYYPLEKGLVTLDFPVEVVRGVPTYLNQLFFAGALDVTPLSSIEYARHPDAAVILPDISVGADGRVGSILLFSRRPVRELHGLKVALTSASATSVVLLKILFACYYRITPEFAIRNASLEAMLQEAEAVLLIGDEALVAAAQVREERLPLEVNDLGAAWKEFTGGEMMVYALWTVRRDFAENYPRETAALAQALNQAKRMALARKEELLREAQRLTGLPLPDLEDYFSLIRHDFDVRYRRALLLFYDYAYKLGLIPERVTKLNVWGE